MKITISDNARKMLKSKLQAGEFLRISIVEGGCAGLTYGAEITSTMNGDEDVVLQEHGIRLVAGKDTGRYLDGLSIDYSDDLLAGGLKFTNEQAKSTCGCGASFNLSGFPVVENGKCGR